MLGNVATRRLSRQRRYRHTGFELLLATAQNDAAQRRDIRKVPAPAKRQVVLIDASGIGGVDVDPALTGTPGRHPGMRSIGTDQSGFARRRVGQDVARDLAGRHADTTQAGDHELGEILTDTTALLEDLGQRRSDGGRAGIEGEVAMNASSKVL